MWTTVAVVQVHMNFMCFFFSWTMSAIEEEMSNLKSLIFCRLAPGCFGGPWLLSAGPLDWDLLVSVLSTHLLLLCQLPLLPGSLLLSTSM